MGVYAPPANDHPPPPGLNSAGDSCGHPGGHTQPPSRYLVSQALCSEGLVTFWFCNKCLGGQPSISHHDKALFFCFCGARSFPSSLKP